MHFWGFGVPGLCIGGPGDCKSKSYYARSAENFGGFFLRICHHERAQEWTHERPRQDLSVPWSLRPQNRAAAATCGRGRCELPAILRATQKSLAASDFFAAENPAISAAEWLRAHLRPPWSLRFCDAIFVPLRTGPTKVDFSVFSTSRTPTKAPTKRPTKASAEEPTKVSSQVVEVLCPVFTCSVRRPPSLVCRVCRGLRKITRATLSRKKLARTLCFDGGLVFCHVFALLNSKNSSFWGNSIFVPVPARGHLFKTNRPPWSIKFSWKIKQNHSHQWFFSHENYRGDLVLVREFRFPAFGHFESAKTKRGRREGDGEKNVTTICDNRHDNLRHGHDNLRHFMTISVFLFHWHKTS